MKKLYLLGAIGICTMLATPTMAQRVIEEPGYCAQFYPNANCQNEGPNNPYTGDYQRNGGTSGPLTSGFFGYNNSVGLDRPGACARGARTFRGDDGRRHRCS